MKNKDRIFLYKLRIEKNKLKKKIFVLLFISLFVTYVVQNHFYFIYWVKDHALEPNYYKNSLLLFKSLDIGDLDNNSLSRDLKRGDLIAFNPLQKKQSNLFNFFELPLYIITLGLYKTKNNKKIVRRILGVAGDKIEIKNKSIYLNGKLFIPIWPIKFQDVRIIPSKISDRDNLPEIFIPHNHIFLLSDNWDVLSDSRNLGVIPLNQVIGIVKKTLRLIDR